MGCLYEKRNNKAFKALRTDYRFPTQCSRVTLIDNKLITYYTKLLGDHSESEPPDPIPNSEVKPLSADDSVAGCHVKVGNCQA